MEEGNNHKLDEAVPTEISKRIVDRKYFQIPCIQLSKKLLGQKLVRMIDGKRVAGIIIETEAYLGDDDKAAHSYQNKVTAKNKSMFLDAGYAYLYNSFIGKAACFNITSDQEGVPAATLIRALYPVEGLDFMEIQRKESKKKLKIHDIHLCSGPSKLCGAMSLNVDELDGEDMMKSEKIWVEFYEDIPHTEIAATPRINIAYAQEWASAPLRFCATKYSKYLSHPLQAAISKRRPKMVIEGTFDLSLLDKYLPKPK
jgi:DNA-3-methyladenine glycosylase